MAECICVGVGTLIIGLTDHSYRHFHHHYRHHHHRHYRHNDYHHHRHHRHYHHAKEGVPGLRAL